MKFHLVILLVFLALVSLDVFGCTGIVEGREEWIQKTAWFAFLFGCCVLFLSIATSVIDWKNMYRPVLLIYTIYLTYYAVNAQIIFDTACRSWKEDFVLAMILMNVIVLIVEAKLIFIYVRAKMVGSDQMAS